MYILGDAEPACLYCGEEVVPGDEVYETYDGYVHTECFYAWFKQYAKDAGWERYIYGRKE